MTGPSSIAGVGIRDPPPRHTGRGRRDGGLVRRRQLRPQAARQARLVDVDAVHPRHHPGRGRVDPVQDQVRRDAEHQHHGDDRDDGRDLARQQVDQAPVAFGARTLEGALVRPEHVDRGEDDPGHGQRRPGCDRRRTSPGSRGTRRRSCSARAARSTRAWPRGRPRRSTASPSRARPSRTGRACGCARTARRSRRRAGPSTARGSPSASRPPLVPCIVNVKMPRITNPMWLTDEYATRRFTSVCIIATRAP